MNNLEWKIASRQWNAEKKYLRSQTVSSHPLQGVVDRPLNSSVSISNSRASAPQPMILDPLSMALDGPDPLSQMLVEPSSAEKIKENSSIQGSISTASNKNVPVELALESLQQHTWDQYRVELQANFSTTHLLTLTSSFLQATEEGVIKTQNSVPDRSRTQGLTGSERIRARLEQLENLDESGVGGSGGPGLREYGGLTQEDFSQRIMGLKQELHNAWDSDQRVKALKICIQCVKLLSSPLPESFYPHKFVLVTDILDVLAQLVYQRLASKSQSEASLAEAQETARNWFYKVASIRELLPRLYLETALLPCYNVLSNQEGENALVRLTKMIRGIGDPILAAYAQMYLCRCGSQVYPQISNYIRENIEDFLHSLKAGVSIDQETCPSSESESLSLLSRIFKPPLEWLMQCLAQRTPHHVLQSVIRACEGSEGLSQSLVLAGILSTFPCSFLAQQAATLNQLIAGCQHPSMSGGELLILLGEAVCVSSPPAPQQLPLLNNVWKLVTRIQNCQEYLDTARPWLHYTAKHFTANEVNTLLGDVLKHVRVDTKSDQPHYPALLKLITTSLCNTSDAHVLFTMNNFLGLVSVFQRDSVSMGGWGVTRSVVEALLNYHPEIISDPNLVHHILTLAGALHDTINAMTTGDERRQLSMLLTSFIRRVDYGRDFEAQLEFYVNCRASFSNLDAVMSVLVQCVCQLAMNTRAVVKGKHSSKTASFVRGCAAYCFITIPSVSSAHVRQRLYLLSASTALLNNCMGQADASLKAAIREVPEILSPSFNHPDSENNDSSPESVRLCMINLASTLLATPDPPDTNTPLYLLRGLFNAIRGQGKGKITDSQVMMEISLLSVISAAGQESLPYSVNGIDGNDIIYGGDPQVLQEAEKMCSAILEDILTYITSRSNGIYEKNCVNVILVLFWCVITWADLSNQYMMNLATFLWSQIIKHKDFQAKLVKDTKIWLVKRSEILRNSHLQQLCKVCNS